jgi:hypothetical protein
LHARIGVMQALNRYVERVFHTWPKETHLGENKKIGINDGDGS